MRCFASRGFERRPFKAGSNPFTRGVDRTRFAEFYAELDSRDKVETVMDSVAVAPITYTGQAELQQDIDHFKAALRGVKVEEAFLPVAAPASVIPDRKNEYYASDDDLQQAIGEAMHTEYKTIIDAGLLVQLDDARAAVSYDRMVPPKTLKDYRAWLARQVEIINHAIAGLPREKIRYHICWGSWPGPHSSDVPFKDIADLVLEVRAGGYSIELANPRHEHEWRLWEHLKLPKDTVLIPGVISHATNIVEHPELIAERDHAARPPGRARERDRRHRLRFCAGDLFRSRASLDHVGQARSPGRGRPAGEQGALAAIHQSPGSKRPRSQAPGSQTWPPAGLSSVDADRRAAVRMISRAGTAWPPRPRRRRDHCAPPPGKRTNRLGALIKA